MRGGRSHKLCVATTAADTTCYSWKGGEQGKGSGASSACEHAHLHTKRAPLSPFHRFLAGSSDSDSDDERRVVKSAKDKSLVDLGACCEDIRVRGRQLGFHTRVLTRTQRTTCIIACAHGNTLMKYTCMCMHTCLCAYYRVYVLVRKFCTLHTRVQAGINKTAKNIHTHA
jgi:hypothetical protein